MTDSPTPKPTPASKNSARPDTAAAVEKISDAMQSGLSVLMALPQKMMHANIEAITESVNFMSRRMKAQAAMWSNGPLGNGSSLSDAQQHFITAMTKEMADEMQEFGDLARKNIGLMTGAVTVAGDGFSPGKSS